MSAVKSVESILESNPLFAGKFFDELVDMSKIKHNVDELDEEMLERVAVVLQNQLSILKDIKTPFSNTLLDTEVDYPFVESMESFFREGHIFSYKGIFSSDKSPIGDLLADMLASRGIYKKKMLEAKANGDDAKARLYDNIQKLKKEVANSLYGVLGEIRFFLYNLTTASSITGNCKNQLQTLISQLEKILTGRVILRDINEVNSYIFNNASGIEELDYLGFFDLIDEPYAQFNTYDYKAAAEEVFSYCQFELSEPQKEDITSYLKSIFDNENLKARFYFLNDMERFF